MMYQELPNHLIVPFHTLFHPAVECPSMMTNCLGIISAKNFMCIKVMQLKPVIANPCTMEREI